MQTKELYQQLTAPTVAAIVVDLGNTKEGQMAYDHLINTYGVREADTLVGQAKEAK